MWHQEQPAPGRSLAVQGQHVVTNPTLGCGGTFWGTSSVVEYYIRSHWLEREVTNSPSILNKQRVLLFGTSFYGGLSFLVAQLVGLGRYTAQLPAF